VDLNTITAVTPLLLGVGGIFGWAYKVATKVLDRRSLLGNRRLRHDFDKFYKSAVNAGKCKEDAYEDAWSKVISIWAISDLDSLPTTAEKGMRKNSRKREMATPSGEAEDRPP
jgi:hypothetical protein